MGAFDVVKLQLLCVKLSEFLYTLMTMTNINNFQRPSSSPVPSRKSPAPITDHHIFTAEPTHNNSEATAPYGLDVKIRIC